MPGSRPTVKKLPSALVGSPVIFAVLMTFFVTACGRARTGNSDSTERGNANALQARLNEHCSAVGKEFLNKNFNESERPSEVKAFYSWKINTCVQVEVNTSSTGWSYTLRDLTYGFFHHGGWSKSEIPLHVINDNRIGWAEAEGFWQSTNASEGQQLAEQIAAKIECTRAESVCRESDAVVFMGTLEPDSHEYAISSWTSAGIVADDNDEGACAIGHRLTIAFKSNSVIETDYPKKVVSMEICKVSQNASSYALRGGSLSSERQNPIFYCDRNGANSAILSKVAAFHGNVETKAFRLWLDNGEGGLPAALETPAHPYSRADCERVMEKTLGEL